MLDRIGSGLRRFGAPALLVLLAACGSAQKGVLPEGPPQGPVVALAYDSAHARLLKAYPHALYGSTNGGVAWRPLPLPRTAEKGRIVAVAVPAGGGGLYVAGPGLGVLRSEDAGKTWVALNQELPSRDVLAFATHADRPNTLYAYVRAEKTGIYRSEDAGRSWRGMDEGPGGPIRQLFHSNMEGSMQSGWLFAATPKEVRRSMDCFCGWRDTGKLPGGEVLAITFDPRQPKQVYAATAAGLFRSADGGQSWTLLSRDTRATALAFDRRTGALYVAAPEGALLRSADQGRTWESVGA